MASTDWEKLHQVFLNNVSEGMYEWLAESLGVKSDALREIEVGWAPTVLMKKGALLTYGWFSSPMRDGNGKITGLALRSRDSAAKVLYPGSKPGCCYVVNPKHVRGSQGYQAGKQNWVRTMDAKELCPVCGKPDGCLLSEEDPSDPKAVICRVTPSLRQTRFGWLHIRKSEGDLSGESLLGGTGPVLVVEGMSDVAAAYSLGYTAIGRPSNTGSQDVVAELVRGRATIVMGENDRKTNGQWPGQEGMTATYQYVRKYTHSAKMLMPPKGSKDLRSWLVKNGLTREQFDVYSEKEATEVVDKLLLPNDDPLTLASALLKEHYTFNRKPLLRRWADSWYLYDKEAGKYVVEKSPHIMQQFYEWSEDKQYEVPGAKGVEIERVVATTALWGNVEAAAGTRVLLKSDVMPFWISGGDGMEPKDLVVFNNGILDVPAFMDNHANYLQPTTPDFFNTTALPLPFNPAAECPTWLSFLASSLDDDTAKIDLLQEWFGYCLTPDTSQQKLMYLRGESGSGKGTILRVLQSVVGRAQHASSSLSQLAEPFGLQPLIGKLICVIGDARVGRSGDAMRGLEVLLGLTGGDAMQVNRKFKDQLEGTYLTARITIASNDFIDVPDTSGAMRRRLNVIQFARKPAVPDTTLSEKLNQELEGIAVWALAGLRRLRQQGFTEPESSRAAMAEWERDTNPLVAWLQDCTRPGVNMVSGKDELYDCWSAWAKDTQRSNWSRTMFLRRMFSNAPYATDVGAGIKGLEILPHAARRYLGRPR
jgi:P4 family phage/plasmid primase-like protien